LIASGRIRREETPVFEEFMGVPLHPLLIHAAVVFVPLLVVASIAYAVVPFVRAYTFWAVALLALAAPGAALLAKLSGDAFRSRLIARNLVSPEILGKVTQHQQFGNMTLWTTIGLGVITLVLVVLVRPRRRGMAGTGRSGPAASRVAVPSAVAVVLAVLTVGAALASLYYVLRTGDSGAKMVWSGF
jgi:uncharacterized membrane protein YhaH (DUF805 family)